MRKCCLIVLALLFFLVSFAQKKPAKKPVYTIPVSSDYASAIKLPLIKNASYGPTVSPKGFGKAKEILACDKEDLYRFEKEHNSAWYYFVAPEDGEIIFDIIPVNPKDDYDFMLYKYTDTSFVSEIKRENISPLRMNMARAGRDSTGSTGLSNESQEEVVVAGPGDPYCAPIKVKKGEKYYLVLDNVRPQGSGHSIRMFYQKEIAISGTLTDDEKKPVEAAVYISSKEGKEMGRILTDASGRYELKTKIHEVEYYTLIYYSDSSFMTCMEINTTSLAKTNYELEDIKITLPKLKAGKKYVLGALYFSGNTSKLLPTSTPSLNSLAVLLKKNSGLKIKIEGHVNNPVNPVNTGPDHALGEARAKAVYDYLIKQGIEKERMDFISYGSLFMIYEKPTSDAERAANNRVEIFILPAR